MSKCLSSSNCILKLISHFPIANLMSAAGKNYRSLIDNDGECSNSSSVMKWTISSKAIFFGIILYILLCGFFAEFFCFNKIHPLKKKKKKIQFQRLES